ncbi:EAL domain-containing protein [Alkanindiges sp. WGS2144]|uniref:EAL domain-containing response regulator n=1 Tax=Alkanindiges sp. WGS2144 TaxID=3366808 RepID=UPI003752309C
MKSHQQNLQLLIIDDEQTTANELVQRLKQHQYNTQFHLLDDQEEFEKAIRSNWDVILFGHAYDLDYKKVVNLLEEHDLEIPVIGIPDSISPSDNEQDSSPEVIEGFKAGLMDVIPRTQLTHLIYAIQRECKYSRYIKKNKKLSNQFKEAERRAQLLVKNSKSAVAYIHDGVHIYTNETYNDLFGYHSLEDLIGMPVVDLIEGEGATSFKEFLRAYTRGSQQSEFKFTGIKADGSYFDAVLQLAPASYDGEECIQIIIQPQLENSAALAAQLAALERVDQLTGLENRRAFEEDLSSALAELKQNPGQHALLYISIGNIGHIHAIAGFAGSDAAIVEISRLIKDRLNPHALYRFRESAFTSILGNQTIEEITETAKALCHLVSEHLIMVENRTVQATISIGVVPINQNSPDANEVLDRAYHSSEKVKLQNQGTTNGIYIYNPAENADSSDSALRELLENAINQGQLQLMFQHIYDTTEQDLALFEVYVRLPLADGKVMTPDEFLAVAQQYQLEGRLDRWVLLNAAKQLKQFMAQYPKARLLINLGAETIQDKALPQIAGKLLSALNSSHNPLILQFNEANVTAYLQLAKIQIDALHETGVQVSINDFGSTLNSKNLLNHLKPDLIKLDRAYMTNLNNEDNFQATQALVNEIQQFDIDIIGGYIEAPQEVAKAWTVGARYLQGYYFQKPTDRLMLTNQEEQL